MISWSMGGSRHGDRGGHLVDQVWKRSPCQGGVVRIDRRKAPKLDHPTECALDDWSDWDHVIENNGSLGKFEATVRALFCGP